VSADQRFSRAYLTYAVGVLVVANLLNYLDRQLVSALEREIVAAYDLSKVEFGGLWSAFTVGYLAFAPVLGWLASRWSRTKLFASCVAVWSLATIGSGIAPDTATLFASRVFIGVGEAGCVVMGPALVAEYASDATRGRLLAIYALGMPLGGTLGYGVGGMAGTLIADWRDAFLIAGLPGVGLAALLLFLREPRGPAPSGSMSVMSARRLGFGGYWLLLRDRPLFLLILGQTFAVVMLVPMLHFCVEFFQADRGMTKLEATTSFGLTALIAGALGSVISGVVGDRLATRSKGAHARLAAIAYAVAIPAIWVGFASESRPVIFVALGIGATAMFASAPANNTSLANLVSPQQRAMAFALTVFATHLFGDMVVPPVFGGVAEAIGTGPAFQWITLALVGSSISCFAAARAIDARASASTSTPGRA
jgi:MFS family permease